MRNLALIIILIITVLISSCTTSSKTNRTETIHSSLVIQNGFNDTIFVKGIRNSENDKLVVLPGKEVLVGKFTHTMYKKDIHSIDELKKFNGIQIILPNKKEITINNIQDEPLTGIIDPLNKGIDWFYLRIDDFYLGGRRVREGQGIEQVYDHCISRNKEFTLQMLSPLVNFNYKKVKYRLVDAREKTLWNKEIESKYYSLLYPDDMIYVTNTGNSIITQHDRILFIDRAGNFSSVIKEDSADYITSFNEFDPDYIPIYEITDSLRYKSDKRDDKDHVISISNYTTDKCYFYFVRYYKTMDIYLVCYSMEKYYEKWRTKINDINFPYYLRVDGNKVITHYLSRNSNSYPSTTSINILVKDDSGNNLLALEKVYRNGNPDVKYDENKKNIILNYPDRSVQTFNIK